MSVFTILAAGLACLAPLVGAYHAPTGDSPVGNPFSLPGSTSTVPVGQDFTVSWNPTTDGTVTLLLLKGPANNLALVGPIAEGIANSGSFVWKPSTDLTPGPTDTTGYGIQLIVDATGQYQYTTQFGISNSGPSPYGYGGSSALSSSVVAPSSSSAAAAQSSLVPTTTVSITSTIVAVSSSTDVVVVTSSLADTTTAVPVTTVAPVTLATSTVSVRLSTASRTPSATTSAPLVTSTGGAASLKAGAMGLVAVAAAAVFAF